MKAGPLATSRWLDVELAQIGITSVWLKDVVPPDPPQMNWCTAQSGNGGSGTGIKRHGPEEIVTKRTRVEVLVGQGLARIDAIPQIGITEQTDYRWRKQFPGMGTVQLKRIGNEKKRLRRAVSDLALDKPILKENARGN